MALQGGCPNSTPGHFMWDLRRTQYIVTDVSSSIMVSSFLLVSFTHAPSSFILLTPSPFKNSN